MTDGRNSGSPADNNIPVLTEIVELEDAAPVAAPAATAPAPASMPITARICARSTASRRRAR